MTWQEFRSRYFPRGREKQLLFSPDEYYGVFFGTLSTLMRCGLITAEEHYQFHNVFLRMTRRFYREHPDLTPIRFNWRKR